MRAAFSHLSAAAATALCAGLAAGSCDHDDDAAPAPPPPATTSDAVEGIWTLTATTKLLLVPEEERTVEIPVELRHVASEGARHHYEVILDGAMPVSGVSPNRCLDDPVQAEVLLETLSPLPPGAQPGAAVFDEDDNELSIGVTGFGTLVEVHDGFEELPGAAYFSLDLKLADGGAAPRWKLRSRASRPNGIEIVGPGWRQETAFEELCQHLWIGARITAATLE